MKLKTLIALFWYLSFLGCAVHRVPEPAAPLSEALQPPSLTDEQLMGLKIPHGLIQDSESEKYAHKQVMQAFLKLREKAAQDGWNLTLISGYRTFGYQRRIWNRQYKELAKDNQLTEKELVKGVLTYTALPGLSRHHWGTELDISEKSLRGQLYGGDANPPKKVSDFYHWMEENAPTFGFCKVYKGQSGIINEEPWHWSYRAFSQIYERQFQSIPDFKRILNDKVLGVDYITKHFKQIYEWQMQSVDPTCSS